MITTKVITVFAAEC